MKKSVTAGTHFNARVVECRLAAKVLLINAVLQIRKKGAFQAWHILPFCVKG